jgi:flagellar secretion chaperone FliS
MNNARTTYRENDVRGSSRVRLVVLLYDQIIQDLTKAAQAIEENKIELRTRYINHAILVIGHLQSPLDFERGGKVAQDLDHFYNVLRQSLVQVQFYPSKEAIGERIAELQSVREAWTEVDRAETSLGATAVTSAATTSVSNTALSGRGYSGADLEPERAHAEWHG